FDELSLNVAEGDFISIIGSNGAGKSTLLNMISGTLQADSGSILLDGDEVINKPEYVRCKSIGRVFQDPSKGVAPNMTILENIALADNKGKNFGF
ncbi:ATP-binding cassette domain-containing protein, partial [Klebsiella pneumoniae]|nr:ATP-binding cassette domain-containing protein [Klebsiella pneumoniae]